MTKPALPKPRFDPRKTAEENQQRSEQLVQEAASCLFEAASQFLAARDIDRSRNTLESAESLLRALEVLRAVAEEAEADEDEEDEEDEDE